MRDLCGMGRAAPRESVRLQQPLDFRKTPLRERRVGQQEPPTVDLVVAEEAGVALADWRVVPEHRPRRSHGGVRHIGKATARGWADATTHLPQSPFSMFTSNLPLRFWELDHSATLAMLPDCVP